MLLAVWQTTWSSTQKKVWHFVTRNSIYASNFPPTRRVQFTLVQKIFNWDLLDEISRLNFSSRCSSPRAHIKCLIEFNNVVTRYSKLKRRGRRWSNTPSTMRSIISIKTAQLILHQILNELKIGFVSIDVSIAQRSSIEMIMIGVKRKLENTNKKISSAAFLDCNLIIVHFECLISRLTSHS